MTRYLLFFLLIAPISLADVLQLKDGSRLEGTLSREESGWTITDSAGKAIYVKDSQIDLIRKTSTQSPAEVAAGRLASLRRSVDNVDDPQQAVDRYKSFIDLIENAPAADEARKDLQIWQERVDQKLVRLGENWVTPQERETAMAQAGQTIEKVVDLMKQHRLKEADSLLDPLLVLDIRNAGATYLKGVIAFNQGQTGAARKYFEQVRQLREDHGPTLNNLAVIAWQQRQQPLAIGLYDLAMQASPVNQRILDNVAEVLNALPDQQKQSAAARRLSQHFEQQDRALQRQMADRGLTRWGATWLDGDKMTKVQEEQEKIKQQVGALAADYQTSQDKVQQIDARIEANKDAMTEINRDRTYRRADGTLAQRPIPSIYYDLKRENDTLESQRTLELERQAQLNQRAILLKQQTPNPAFTGTQRIIEAEGLPAAPPTSAMPTEPPTLAAPPTSATPTATPPPAAPPAPAATQESSPEAAPADNN